jgi:hypothetical protein
MDYKIKVCERTKLLRWEDVKRKRLEHLQKLIDVIDKSKNTQLKQTA